MVRIDRTALLFGLWSNFGSPGMFQFARLVMTNLHYQSRAFRLQEELKWLSEANENLGVLGKLEEA
jgi:hypothetical protein